MVTPRLDSHSTINIEENDIESEVLAITSVTSEKFVAAPNKTNVISDLLIGLKRFRNATRWKAFFHDKKKEDNKEDNETNIKCRLVGCIALPICPNMCRSSLFLHSEEFVLLNYKFSLHIHNYTFFRYYLYYII